MCKNLLRALSLVSLLLLAGCGGGVAQSPIDPGSPDITLQSDMYANNRHIVGLWAAEVSKDHRSVEITPLRAADFHLNVTRMLEVGLCDDCLTISNLQSPAPGEISLDLTIKHPIENPANLNFTAFDLRAIFISGGEYTFPASGRLAAIGDAFPRLVNFDGCTSLFNPTEYPQALPVPPVYKYYKGKYAIGSNLTATLNPYIAYGKDNPRRMFLSGTEETKSVHLKIPSGGFQFGYAVDVSWVDPGAPVVDPVTDFPPEANSIEAYQIMVDMPEPLSDVPAVPAEIRVAVFDHQGFDTIDAAYVEAPELFDGTVQLDFTASNPDGGFLFTGEIENAKSAVLGEYPILVRVIDKVSDPNMGQIDAWMLSTVEVVEYVPPPIAKAAADPLSADIGVPIHFYDDGSYHPDGWAITKYEWDWENDGIFDEEGPDVNHAFLAAGLHKVQFRVTAENGGVDTLDAPLEILIEEDQTFNLQDVTPDTLNLDIGSYGAFGDYVYIQDGYIFDYWFFDVSDVSHPVPVTKIDTFEMYYVFDGYGYAYTGTGWQIIDLTSPEDPQVVGFIDALYGAYRLFATGGYLYMDTYHDDQEWLEIWDIDPPGSAYLVKLVPLEHPSALFVYVKDGLAYLHYYQDLYVYDVDPPESAAYVGTMPLPTVFGDLAASGDYAYVSDDQDDVLYVVDVADPSSPQIVNTINSVDKFGSLTVEGNYLYAGEAGAVEVYDISDGASPVAVNTIEAVGWVAGRVVLEGNRAYFEDLGGLAIVDNTVPESAQTVGYIGTAWAAKETRVDGSYACILKSGKVGDNQVRCIQLADISDPGAAWITSARPAPGDLTDYDIRDGYVYLLTPGALRIFKIEPPGVLNLVATWEGGSLIRVRDGLGYLLHSNNLSILDLNPPESVNEISVTPCGMSGGGLDLEIDSGYAYIAHAEDGLTIVDVDPPESAAPVGDSGFGGNTFDDMAVANGYAYAFNGFLFVDPPGSEWIPIFTVLDVDPPDAAHEIVHFWPCGFYAKSLVAGNGYVFTAGWSNGMQIVDVNPPETTSVVTNLILPGYAQHISMIDNYAYVTCQYQGVRVVKVW